MLAVPLFGFDCGAGPKEVVRPPRPLFECPLPATLEAEAGIGPVPEDNRIKLRWPHNPDSGIVEYVIWRRSADDLLDWPYDTVDVRDATKTTVKEYFDANISLNKTYYYVLFAYDAAHNRSARSDTAFYRLLEKPALSSPKAGATVATSRPLFSFQPQGSSRNISGYVVRVRKDDNKGTGAVQWVSPLTIISGFLQTEPTTVTYAYDGTVVAAQLDNGGHYEWRVDFYNNSPTLEERPLASRCFSDGSDAASSLPAAKLIYSVGSKSEWRKFKVEY